MDSAICLLNNWKKVLDEILSEINKSGLIDETSCIFFSVVGGDIKEINGYFKNPKYVLRYYSPNMSEQEIQTLNILRDDCLNYFDDCNILYLHTKGLTNQYNQNVISWRKYLEYFNITKYKDCLGSLEKFETCGVNLEYHNNQYIYSGNYWWAKSQFIKTLDYFNPYASRLLAEFWICLKATRMISLHNSNINHYYEEYPLTNYEDNIKKFEIIPLLEKAESKR